MDGNFILAEKSNRGEEFGAGRRDASHTEAEARLTVVGSEE
jgi:hypothetical protein